jgi:hypothetical protein
MQQFSETPQRPIQQEESFFIGDLLIVDWVSPGNIICNDGHLQLSHSQSVGNVLVFDPVDCGHIFGQRFLAAQEGGDFSLKVASVKSNILIHVNQH